MRGSIIGASSEASSTASLGWVGLAWLGLAWLGLAFLAAEGRTFPWPRFNRLVRFFPYTIYGNHFILLAQQIQMNYVDRRTSKSLSCSSIK